MAFKTIHFGWRVTWTSAFGSFTDSHHSSAFSTGIWNIVVKISSRRSPIYRHDLSVLKLESYATISRFNILRWLRFPSDLSVVWIAKYETPRRDTSVECGAYSKISGSEVAGSDQSITRRVARNARERRKLIIYANTHTYFEYPANLNFSSMMIIIFAPKEAGIERNMMFT